MARFTTDRGINLNPTQIKNARSGASLQDQSKTTGQRAREKGIIANSNGQDVGRQFNGNLFGSNQSDVVVSTEPATQAGSPFFLAGGIVSPDLFSSANDTSNLDPASGFDKNSKDTKEGTLSNIRPNPLNKFVNYTYNIRLGVMTPEMLNAFTDGDYESLNQNIILGTGGIPADQRAPYFDVDFYIDDIELESFIGLQQVTGGANATQINFTITEPSGLSFFNRLVACANDLGIRNYIDVPYFLKIQFYGYDDIEDSNEFTKTSIPFIVPIKMSEIKNSVTAAGGVYNVEAVAFYDSPLFSNECHIKENFSAKPKTLGDFFDQLTTNYNNFYKNTSLSQRAGASDAPIGDEFYHTIKFEIDEEIRKQPIKFNKELKTVDKAPMVPTPQGGFAVTASAGYIDAQTKIPPDDIRVDFPNGTNIIQMINDVIIQQSNYIKSQKLNPEEVKRVENLDDVEKQTQELERLSAQLEKPLKWFRIRTKKKYKQYNKALGQYARENIFVIKPYEVYNRTIPDYPGWGELRPVKKYDYIFTGENNDVLNFNIQFDMVYYQGILGNPDKSKQGSGETTKTGKQREEFTKTSAGDNEQQGGIQPAQTEPVPASIRYGQGTDDANYQAQSDEILQQNLYTNQTGDMVEVTLDIIGDPDFLVGYNEEDIAGDDNINILNSAEEINCYVSYKTPQDFDENTGMLVTPDNPIYFDSAFSGVYKIISVQSSFKGGSFTQQLTLVRLFNQPGLYTKPRRKVEEEKIGGTTQGSLSSMSSGSSVFTGLAAHSTQEPASSKNAPDEPVIVDNATSLGNTPNIAQSNGSSVFAGLAASNSSQPATNTAGAGQTPLSEGQKRAIQQGNFQAGLR